jgi:hypothetical protein
MTNVSKAAKRLNYDPHYVEGVVFGYVKEDLSRAPGAQWPILDQEHSGSLNQTLVSFEERLELMVKRDHFTSMKRKLRKLWSRLWCLGGNRY